MSNWLDVAVILPEIDRRVYSIPGPLGSISMWSATEDLRRSGGADAGDEARTCVAANERCPASASARSSGPMIRSAVSGSGTSGVREMHAASMIERMPGASGGPAT